MDYVSERGEGESGGKEGGRGGKEDIRKSVIGLEEYVEVVPHELDRSLVALTHFSLQSLKAKLQIKEGSVAMGLEKKPNWVEVFS